jgi:MFS family permease
VVSVGYEPLHGTEQLSTDHLPPLLRKTGWEWRGDFFDPEIPPSVDLHFQLWDASTERFEAPGVEQFWPRRIRQEGLPVLDPADRLGYAALHLLRHLLRSSVRACHVYELAYFLENHYEDENFWNRWQELHPQALRKLEAISFRLAADWFACRLPVAVKDEIECLPEDVTSWFERFAASPVEALFHPNKHELWLHFALLDSARDRRRIFVRRVFPATLPGPVDAAFIPINQMTWRLRVRKGVKYARHLAERTGYHARTLPATLWHCLMWQRRTSILTRSFWIFLSVAALYNLGVSVFFLLYNLYLLDRGYREDFLGSVASALTVGSIAGVLPAAALARRFGLKRAVMVCFAGSSIALALRVLLSGSPGVLISTCLSGMFLSIWAVSISPVVAALTTERARPTAFSLTFGSGIAVGILAGLIGGHLPRWIANAGFAASQAQAKQIALLSSAAFAMLAFWPLARLRIQSPASVEKRSYPRGRFIAQFLVAIAVWSFATGLFNPLFNAYFSRRLRMPVESIGMVFSISQAAQVGAILLAPLVLRRLGVSRAVAAMQLAAAATLALLATAPAALAAGMLYAGYMSFQYMSEPGIYSGLMNRVTPEQRSGASALNFLAIFLAQALAASLAGIVIARFGYTPMLAIAAIIAAAASLLFRRLPLNRSLNR